MSTFTSTVCHADTYPTWKARVFTVPDQGNPAVSGETANPSGDGINNLEKYAFGLNPYVNTATGKPTFSTVVQTGVTYPALTFQIASTNPPTDLLYIPESTADLVTWSQGSPAITLYSTSGPTGGLNFYTYIANTLPVSSTQKGFMRVQIAETAVISVASGTYATPQTVTVTGPAGSTLYYTLNGTAPTTSSSVYGGPITIGYSQTLNVQVYVGGVPYGGVVTASYTITPTLTIIAGNGQGGGNGTVLPQPFTVLLTGEPPSSPVTFTVTSGGGKISLTGPGTPTASPIMVNANSSGQAEVYFTLPASVSGSDVVTVSAGSATPVVFTANASPTTPTAPMGNNSQGGVSAPPGLYGVTPTAGPVPLNAYTGNTSRVVDDLSSPAVGEIGLEWKRYFHSRLTDGQTLFDTVGNWRHSFQFDFSFITVGGQSEIEVVYPDGTTNDFAVDPTNSNRYVSTLSVDDVIYNTTAGGITSYQLVRSNNQTYNFLTATVNSATVYYLANIFDSKGSETVLTWGHPIVGGVTQTNNWTLNKITEPGGNSLTITYAAYTSGLGVGLLVVNTVTTPDNRSVTYGYGAETVGSFTYVALYSATYTDTTSAQYYYWSSTVPPETQVCFDTRAEGVPSLELYYYDTAYTGTGAASGTIVALQDEVSSFILEINNLTTNSQTPIVSYPSTTTGNIYTALTYQVNSQGTVTSITNSDPNFNVNATARFAYSTTMAGNIQTTSTDANGNTTVTVKTTSGQLVSRTYPKVVTEFSAPTENWTYTTDSNHFHYLSTYQDLNGNITRYFYTANYWTSEPALLTSIQYPDTTTESFTYDPNLIQNHHIYQILTHTRRNGGVEHFTYNQTTGLLLTKQDAAQTTGQNTTYAYETTSQRVHTVEDANSYTTTFTYNDRGQVTQLQFQDTTTKKWGYNTLGQMTSTTDELTHTWNYTYDNLNRLLTAQDPLSHTATLVYSPVQPGNPNPVQVTSQSGKQKLISYAMLWGYKAVQVTSEGVSGVNPATTTTGYDPVGNVTSQQDGNLNTTLLTYDARNRKASSTDPASNTIYFFYDDNSNLTSQVTPEGTTQNTYDSMNRFKTSIDPKLQEAQLFYDNEGQLLQYIDPNNNTYNYTCDLDERRTGIEYPDTSTESWLYDPVGNLHTFTTRDSKVQTFSYDNRNRNTGYTWNDGVTPSVTKTYYNNSEIHLLSNANSALTYTYDNARKLLTEAQNITGLGTQTVTYAYNTDDTQNTITYPDGTILTYGYDGRNNITSVKQTGVTTSVSTYGYDNNNNRTSKVLGNGVSSALTFDSIERVTSLTDTVSSTTLQSFSCGYDASSRVKYVKRNGGLGDVFAYDSCDQITGVEYGAMNPDTTPTSPARTVSYSLDAAGNRTQLIDSTASPTTTVFTPNANNQYSAVAGNSLTYDGRANLKTYGGWTYTYDAENRLTQLTNGTVTETFYYDPLGRCVATFNSSTTTTTYSVFDVGWNILEDFTAVNALPLHGTTTELQRYVHGVNTDEILTKTTISGGAVIYYHNDGAGNVTKLTNSSGTLVEQYTYDIFGAPTIENGSGTVISSTGFANRFMYAGREFVAVASIYEFRTRMFSPSLGRFLQPDPIGHQGDGYNIYSFCGNNPVNNADPNGLDPIGNYLSAPDSYSSYDFGSDSTNSGITYYAGTDYGPISYSYYNVGTSGSSYSGNQLAFDRVTQGEVISQTFRSGSSTPSAPSETAIAAAVPFFIGKVGDYPLLPQLIKIYVHQVAQFEADVKNAPSSGEARSGLALDAMAFIMPDVGGPAEGIRFAQKGISSTFRNGEFAGQSIYDVAQGLKTGEISANQLPLNVIIRDGSIYTLNNRSLMTLRLGGLNPTIINNVTGNAFFEGQLTLRLQEIGTPVGADFVPKIRN